MRDHVVLWQRCHELVFRKKHREKLHIMSDNFVILVCSRSDSGSAPTSILSSGCIPISLSIQTTSPDSD